MSDIYDIVVTPRMLEYKMVTLSGGVSVRYLQTITLPGTGNRQVETFNWSYTISNRTPGSKIFASIRKGGGYNVSEGRFPVYRVNMIRKVEISGNTLNVQVYSDCWDGDGIDNSGIIDIYEVLGQETQQVADYGLYIADSVDWTMFLTNSEICALAYFGRVSLTSSGWVVPDSIKNKKFIIFGDWSSSSAVIQYDNDSKKIIMIGSSSPVEIELYIFAIAPELTVPDYGIVMYNDSGVMTFSSENVPICYPNSSLSLNGTFKSLPFNNNLVQITDFGYTTRTTNNRFWVYQVGIIKSGNTAKLSAGRELDNFGIKILAGDYIYPQINILAIDKKIYSNV